MRYNLDDYETVDDRIQRFYADHPDGRIVTFEVTDEADRARGYFVVRAQIFTDHEDQHANCPKATGLAFEIEGTSGANVTSSLENCETSAIGRALANAGYSSSKKGRASREEMEKVQRGPVPRSEPTVPEGFDVRIGACESLDDLEKLWKSAVEGGFSGTVKELFSTRKKEIQNGQAKKA